MWVHSAFTCKQNMYVLYIQYNAVNTPGYRAVPLIVALLWNDSRGQYTPLQQFLSCLELKPPLNFQT